MGISGVEVRGFGAPPQNWLEDQRTARTYPTFPEAKVTLGPLGSPCLGRGEVPSTPVAADWDARRTTGRGDVRFMKSRLLGRAGTWFLDA